MNSTNPQPIIAPVRLPNRRDGYELLVDYDYKWEANGAAWQISIPAGFKYDGASVPRIFWTLSNITPDGLHRAAALIHDWLYVHKGDLPLGSFLKNGGICREPWTREQADKLFANMLAEFGVGKFRRRLMYLAVRAGGWVFWKT